MSDQANLYAPPEARVDDVRADTELELAGRGTRLGAVILDGLSFAVLGIVAAVVIPMLKDSRAAGIVLGLVFLGVIAALAVVNIIFLYRNGQTIGKKILAIKVVRSDGERVTLLRFFFLRFLPVALLGAIPFVGYVVSLVDALLIFRTSHQCLHDNIADTIVVRA